MKFFHTLRQDLNKTIINLGFIGAALMTHSPGLHGQRHHKKLLGVRVDLYL